METLYFSLGIASVVVTVISVVAVWAIVKVSKLTTQLRDLKQYTEDGLKSAHYDMTMVQRTIENGIEVRSRDTDSTFDNMSRELNDRFNDLYRELDILNKASIDRDEQLNRHIDSRIDKLSVNKKKETLTA
jgi:hypothetical protein